MQYGLAECFDSSLYPAALCCDTQYGPEGFPRCWDDYFTFQRCCPADAVPVCSLALCEEVWGFLAPSSQQTFREFWRSNSFYAVRRVWEQSTNCTMAYVASRALAFTKLPWEAQWEVLHSPTRATRSANFQLPAIVHVFRAMMLQIPLWTLVASPPWSSFVFHRLYGHKKKIGYSFMSDGLPLLKGKLPVSDVHDAPEDDAFWALLQYNLNRGLPPPANQAHTYLQGSSGKDQPRRISIYGQISAQLALAIHALSSAGDDVRAGDVYNVYGAEDAIRSAGGLLRGWAAQHEFGDLFFTRWPVLRLLALTSDVLGQSPPASPPEVPPVWWIRPHLRLSATWQTAVLVLTCGYISVTLPMDYGWTLRVMPGDSDSCVQAYREVSRDLVMQHTWVLLLSPYTWSWRVQHAMAVRDMLALLADAKASAVGFPMVSRAGKWRWPVRRLRRRGSSLKYSGYPTGYPGASGPCASGDSTSGTRAYRSGAFLELLGGVRCGLASTFYVELDLLSSQQAGDSGTTVMTCMAMPLNEDDYLDFAELPTCLAQHHDVEEADFLPTRHRFACRPRDVQSSMQINTSVAASGPWHSSNLSPCTLLDVAEVLQQVQSIWSSGHGGRVVVDCAVDSFQSHCWPAIQLQAGAGFETRCGAANNSREGCATPERLCGEIGEYSHGFGKCHVQAEDLILVCGQRAAGCLEFMFNQDKAVPSIQVLLLGTLIWSYSTARIGLETSQSSLPTSTNDERCVLLDASNDATWFLYCGPLDLPRMIGTGCMGQLLRHPLADCANVLRHAIKRIPSYAWVILVSPFTWDWGPGQTRTVAATIRAMQAQNLSIVGFPTLDREKVWSWPSKSLRHQFWKLFYSDGRQYLPDAVTACESADTTSGTRVYSPGALQHMLATTTATDPATLLVELDILGLKAGAGQTWTCPSPPMHEDSFLELAVLPAAFADRHQIEAARYTATNIHVECLTTNATGPWALAHKLSHQRLATRLCYRKQVEDNFCRIVNWWRQVDPERNFASVKQGTLLTAMIRGGEVSMMPWDNDLELSLYSLGPNPLLGWCAWHIEWEARAHCIVQKLEGELGMNASPSSDLLPPWLYEEHLSLAKFKAEVAGVFDVNFQGWVNDMPISVVMFGRVEVHVNWDLWEHLFFEIFSGSWTKKVGTSGNIVSGADHCPSEHNACIPACQWKEQNSSRVQRFCIFEFDDYFAHTRDPYGEMFPMDNW